MKIYKAAIIGLGPSGSAVNKILFGDSTNEINAFENDDINKRDNFFGFWLTDWMKPFENIVEKKWHKWIIGDKNITITHNSDEKPYCVISFKKWKNFCLQSKNKLVVKNKQVVQYFPTKNYYKIIKPQHALKRLDFLTKKYNPFITTEVGQHQMWAAQFLTFNKPKHWMTAGGLVTMGYGLPAAMGVQIAHPNSLVIDVAGEASILMNIQEMSTIKQFRLPVKIFILNNHYMGMVRQWQELLHGNRLSESYMDSLPDFVKLAESFGATGLRIERPGDVDDSIKEMIRIKGPVICDVVVDPNENCFPMIPSGSTHNQMLLGPKDQKGKKITGKGKTLV